MAMDADDLKFWVEMAAERMKDEEKAWQKTGK